MKTKTYLCRTILSLLSVLLLLNGCGTDEVPETSAPADASFVPDKTELDIADEAKEKKASESPRSAEKKEEEKLELLLYYDTYNKEYMDFLVENFREYYPEVTVLLRDYTDMHYREAKTQLGEDLKNGNAPDLILDYVPAGYTRIPDLMPLLDDRSKMAVWEKILDGELDWHMVSALLPYAEAYRTQMEAAVIDGALPWETLDLLRRTQIAMRERKRRDT